MQAGDLVKKYHYSLYSGLCNNAVYCMGVFVPIYVGRGEAQSVAIDVKIGLFNTNFVFLSYFISLMLSILHHRPC